MRSFLISCILFSNLRTEEQMLSISGSRQLARYIRHPLICIFPCSIVYPYKIQFSPPKAYSVLQQVCVALAVAERTLEFEHRDLHWGNILVAQTKDQVMSFRVDNKPYEIKTHGVKASIIDFTLSRISKGCVTFFFQIIIHQCTRQYWLIMPIWVSVPFIGGVTVFQDLAADPSLFTMDGAQDYQFEIYRMMKQVMINEWSRFEPVTNVYWLHYLTDKFRNKVGGFHCFIF